MNLNKCINKGETNWFTGSPTFTVYSKLITNREYNNKLKTISLKLTQVVLTTERNNVWWISSVFDVFNYIVFKSAMWSVSSCQWNHLRKCALKIIKMSTLSKLSLVTQCFNGMQLVRIAGMLLLFVVAHIRALKTKQTV